jgi:hypothetical protein
VDVCAEVEVKLLITLLFVVVFGVRNLRPLLGVVEVEGICDVEEVLNCCPTNEPFV